VWPQSCKGATTARQLEDTSAQSGLVQVPGQQHKKEITGSSVAKVLSTGSSHYLTDWGGMAIGEANRLYKDKLSAVSVEKTAMQTTQPPELAGTA
jgi:hypothetical protein